MNAIVAAVLLAVVATCSGTGVVSTLGGSQLYYPSTLGYSSGYQYVLPQSQYQYQYVQQPIVSSSNVVSSASVPVTYASSAGVIPSTYYGNYGLNYPYVYNSYVPLKK
ncbi:hypothetical protein Ocin01_06358 [Orchesella cincta]|uniref:Uncharacterized protein n=1 Tax=Orchesella cincta TaxID=48709 RepID=A0A1D2N5I6_ORCCI|nr:hypothetical protein Ocin01_06358 [Orchesella cincta]